VIGQWIGDIEGETPGTLRVELEDRGAGCVGRAYIFYPNANLPGFLFDLRLPKEPPFKITVQTIYLYTAGGIMTAEDRRRAEEQLKADLGFTPPAQYDVEFSRDGENLKVDWSGYVIKNGDPKELGGLLRRLKRKNGAIEEELKGTIVLSLSDTTGLSKLRSRADLSTWSDFRQWAVSQNPRNYIFRGQSNPHKLASSFHRTWRNNLSTWITDDTSILFNAVAERLNYPLQPGNLLHNAAIWSILQHHGYPTPMLDWSFSPFVAAYFAFQDASEGDCAPRVFIFDAARWNARYGRVGFTVDAAPNQLIVVESIPIANPRHSPQQAISTVTNIADVEEFIRKREEEDGVSYLTVCDLPAYSRPQIMRELELMGITYGSLFPGLDGICRDLRDRLFAPPIPA
jgi:hypothetical protein